MRFGRRRDAETSLTVEHHSHLGLEVVVGELPEGEGLPGSLLQHAEADADGVFRRETCRVDEPGRRRGKVILLSHLKMQ